MAGIMPSNLYGLVDMGSNGIRFSISDLTPPARALPTIFQDRAGISLYDAQYVSGEKGPIPQDVINEVLAALARFKTACTDFDVPDANIQILATEATRTAANSVEYRQQIKDATGWEVKMLPKEAEGRIGALGVASSFSQVKGLVMDLGGGSTQITWMIADAGEIETSPKGSFSFPYGAAAMTRLLADVEEKGESARTNLEQEMKANFQKAYDELEIPDSLHAMAAQEGGFTLYLSGGGFRGWGYLLMSQHKVSPYPIPIINGFQVTKRDFQNVVQLEKVATEQETFRVSKRRAAQVPAVAFLVNILIDALPNIKEIRFCQGGVREGFLFDTFDKTTRAMDPLSAASTKFASPSAPRIAELLMSAVPPNCDELDRGVPSSFTAPVIQALANLLFAHSSLPKESTSLAALYSPITGLLASAHGVSHTDRALLALILCQRWNGEIAPPHDMLQDRLRSILTRQEVFWCNYLGTVANLVGNVYPAGKIGQSERIAFKSKWSAGLGKKGLDQGIRLTIEVKNGDPMTSPEALRPALEGIEAVGKKKNRVGGRDGFGVPVEISVERS